METAKLPTIIGIGGTFASGKDSLAKALVKDYGYTHVSTGDMVRVAARERYGSIERPILVKVGAELRREGGPGILAERALATDQRPIVVSGIRTAGEVTAIKKAGGVMVFVDADPTVRYQRMRGRSRDNETELTLDEFLAHEAQEVKIKDDDTDQNIGVVKSMTDITLDNSGDFQTFLDGAVEKLSKFEPLLS